MERAWFWTYPTLEHRWPIIYSGASAGEATGGICYDSNTATFPAPASNRLLQDRVTDLEFRRNPNGSLRIGFAAGFIGYPRRQFGTAEADLVRFSTSVTRRN